MERAMRQKYTKYIKINSKNKNRFFAEKRFFAIDFWNSSFKIRFSKIDIQNSNFKERFAKFDF